MGTATAASTVTTNIYTMARRTEALVTTAATTAIAGWYLNGRNWYVGGPTAGLGGSDFVGTGGPATGVATTTNRFFFGMTVSAAAGTDVEPSSLLNIVGMGWDAADANIRFMHNDGAGVATEIDFGASFPVPTVDRSKWYRLEMITPPGTTQSMTWRIIDLGTSAVCAGTATTDLPTAATFLSPRISMSVGGTSSVIGVALGNIHIRGGF
jgi:hypothetical protein